MNIKDVRGGDEENRTPDPLLARQVLSQLSYTPTWCVSFEVSTEPSKVIAIKLCLVLVILLIAVPT